MVVQQTIFRFSLDHVPIVLASKGLLSGPRLFRFYNTWCEHPNFRIVVKVELEGNVNTDHNLWGRLKVIRGAVHRWQGEQYN